MTDGPVIDIRPAGERATTLEWRVAYDTKLGTIPGYGPAWRQGAFTCKSEAHAHRYAEAIQRDRRWYRNVTIESRVVGPWTAIARTTTGRRT